MDIAAWLRSLGLEQYEAAFVENAIDAAVLPSLTGDDLKELGVVAVGHRRRLLDAIAQLRPSAAPTAPGAPPPGTLPADAERRHLTVLFADLVGSTQLSTQLDPEDMRTILLAYQRAAAAAITGVAGHVAKYMGDGVLAYFGWPIARENDGERAIRAGLALQAAVAQLRGPGGAPLAARVGIATGLVVVGDLVGEGAAQERAVVGDTPNLAARLQGLAAPGVIVIAETTRRLVGGMFDLDDLGMHDLKGLGPTRGFAVRGERALASRFAARAGDGLAALVGRERELEQLLTAWRLAGAGRGQFVVLAGDAGMGKSRLLEAFLEHIADAPQHRLRWQCSPYHQGTPLHPVLQQVAIAAGLAQVDGTEARRATLAAHLRQHEPRSDADLDLLAALFGLEPAAGDPVAAPSPQQRRVRTLQALGRYLLGFAADRPLLLALEDAHWIDPSTRDLLAEVADQLRAASVLLVVTTRPEALGELGFHPAIQRIVLGRLAGDAIAGLAQAAAGGRPLPAAWLAAIAARADGVPLYIEEMARAAVDSGLLAGGAAAADAAIPATLHDSLMARLDRHPAEKPVAQMAAVIGRGFPFGMLRDLAAVPEPDLERSLDVLTGAELVFRHGLPPAADYQWKHALVRDAAYASLLKSRRQVLHARLLRLLEAVPDSAPEVLACHADAADLPQQAMHYWRLAGDRAMARPAYAEALRCYERAVEVAATQSDGREAELELRTRWGLASISARGHSHPDTCAIFQAALRCCAVVPRRDLTFVSWYGLWCGHHVRSDVAAARTSAQALHDAAAAVGSPSHRLMGARALAITAVMGGDFAAGLRHHEAARALHEPARDREFLAIVGQDQAVSFRSYFALNLWVVGRVDEAWQLAAESIELGKRSQHVNSLGYGYMHATLLAVCAGRPEAPQLVAEMVAHASEHHLAMWREFGLQFQAILRLGGGDRGALGDLLAARRALAERHAHLFSSLLALEAAQRLLALQEVAAATSLVAEAQQTIAATGEAYAAAECLRLLALLAARRGEDAAAGLGAAMGMASTQGAGLWQERILASGWAPERGHQPG